jgi:hypothetical protein
VCEFVPPSFAVRCALAARSDGAASERPSATSHNYTAFPRFHYRLMTAFPLDFRRKTTANESKTFPPSQPLVQRLVRRLPSLLSTYGQRRSALAAMARPLVYLSYSVLSLHFRTFSSILLDIFSYVWHSIDVHTHLLWSSITPVQHLLVVGTTCIYATSLLVEEGTFVSNEHHQYLIQFQCVFLSSLPLLCIFHFVLPHSMLVLVEPLSATSLPKSLVLSLLSSLTSLLPWTAPISQPLP